jgi:hypothetical protein
MDERVSIEAETIKLLEEIIRGNVYDICLGNDLLAMTPQSTVDKSRNRQIELHQSKRLLLSKRNNQQREDTTYGMRENVCEPCPLQEVTTQVLEKGALAHC